jgi:hypothetical protein
MYKQEKLENHTNLIPPGLGLQKNMKHDKIENTKKHGTTVSYQIFKQET